MKRNSQARSLYIKTIVDSYSSGFNLELYDTMQHLMDEAINCHMWYLNYYIQEIKVLCKDLIHQEILGILEESHANLSDHTLQDNLLKVINYINKKEEII